MFKLEIIANAFVITDLVSGRVKIDEPVVDVYGRCNGVNVAFYERHKTDRVNFNLVTLPIADCEDSGGNAFSEATIKAFIRSSLGGVSSSVALPTTGVSLGLGSDDGQILDADSGNHFILETDGDRSISGGTGVIHIFNNTNNSVSVEGIDISTKGNSTLLDSNGTWVPFIASLLFVLLSVFPVSAQEAVQLRGLTTAERDAKTLPAAEQRLIYNTDEDEVQLWSEGAWGPVADMTPTAIATSGRHLIRSDRPVSPIAVVSTNPIVTGHDLTKYTKGKLEFHFHDATSGNHKWQVAEIDIEIAIERFNNPTNIIEHSVELFDNDYMQFQLVDLATGTFALNDVGRAMDYIRSDLYAVLETPVETVQALLGEFTESTPIPGTSLTPIETGIDLTDAYKIEVTINNNGLQAATSSVLFSEFVLDNNQGALLHWWNDDFLRMRINSADLATGRISFSAHGTVNFRVAAITVWKLVETGTSGLPRSDAETTLQFNTLEEIPPPSTFQSGDVLTVTNDPDVGENGSYLILGPVGSTGTSLIPN